MRSDDLNVAIDGPAGVGKTTTARALASRMGLLYVDTGAMYRRSPVRCAGLPLDHGRGSATWRGTTSGSSRCMGVRVFLDGRM
jgi:cytidylate kinase